MSVTVSPPAVRNCTSRWNVFTAASLQSVSATGAALEQTLCQSDDGHGRANPLGSTSAGP